MLELKNVNKYFHRGKKNQIHVIDHTSLKLPDTGLVALLGPSGCGKTTLLNAIGGLDKIKSGTITIDGKKISTRFIHQVDKIRNLSIGYIFQDYKLIDDLSVYDNVAIVLKMLGMKDKKEIQTRVEYVLECVGMLRYQKRPAGMLSGGERQRVGIARAIVKNPNIILADEPTGNLDSKNTLEIMKIIKAISKNRLVILVTHEQNLATFYADRIIRIADGKILSDEENTYDHDLDYEIDNCFYLKDFKKKNTYQEKECCISLYQNEEENISLDMVVRNGNIYIKSNNSLSVEVVDDTSNIEFIDGHYQKIGKEHLNEYQFDFSKIDNHHFKKKYTSITNPFSSLRTGFLKVLNYPLLKKFLFIGFFLAGLFIMYSTSSIAATLQLHQEDFIQIDPHYLIVEKGKNTDEDYLNYQNSPNVLYVLPGKSEVSFQFLVQDYYQTLEFNDGKLTGSLVSLSMLKKSDLIKGEMPTNDHEIVIDKLVATRLMNDYSNYQMVGIINIDDFLGRVVSVSNLGDFKIVGITDQVSPNIYVAQEMMVPIIINSNLKNDSDTSESKNLIAYSLYQDKISIKKGRAPVNDNEIIVNINNESTMPLNKEIKISEHDSRVVVGYYTSLEGYQSYFATDKAVLSNYLEKNKYLSIYTNEEKNVISTFQEKKINIYSSYQRSLKEYQDQKKESRKTTLIVSGIILAISFIEIFLMIRSSFLSRIKEIGIYRAIGIKITDIYSMFSGEIIAITTLVEIPGLLLMAYILDVLSEVKILSKMIFISPTLILVSILLVYLFNLLFGLLPIYFTVRKRPAEILSRYDVD